LKIWQVYRRIKARATLEDLNVQGVLSHGKTLRGVKEPRWKKSKPKVEGPKTGLSGFGFQNIWVFSEHIESDLGLRFSLFRKDFLISD
jgi:hypothetical protein